jgi:hypothetical protein
MPFGHNRTKAPRVRNYEEALHLFNTIYPIRGRATEIRPFVKRSDDSRTVHMNADNSIALRLHATDVVIFRKGKPVEININGFATQTTTGFLNDVLGSTKLGFCQFDGRIWVGTSLTQSQEYGRYPLSSEEPTLISQNTDGVHCVLDKPMFPVVHHINRREANNVRSKYKPFKDYMTRMLKLRGNCVLTHEFGDAFGWLERRSPIMPSLLEVRLWNKPPPWVLEEFFELCLSTEPQDNNKALLWLSRVGLTRLVDDGHTPNVLTFGMQYHLDTLILLHHKQECFIKKVITDGRLVKDKYEAYFN